VRAAARRLRLHVGAPSPPAGYSYSPHRPLTTPRRRWEYPVCKAYADARVQRIYGGANEIMKELIARTI
jgi:alkylation response protein AidB-like acyl-CoA dehydrogenase